MPDDSRPGVVVKVGGSLYDLPDLGLRLDAYLSSLLVRRVLIVPGGGRSADMVRDWDRQHHLGEEKSHWLALRALSLCAHFLADLLPRAGVVERMGQCGNLWRITSIPVLDPYPLAVADDGHPEHLPHSWEVTSDSLAARVAVLSGAPRLVLLKSQALPPGIDWSEASNLGYVDPFFPRALDGSFEIDFVNLRVGQPGGPW